MRLDQIQGINAGYVAELYERYRENPESIDPASRAVFESWVPADQAQQATGRSDVAINVIVGAANLAECVRRYGHLAAQIDPLGSVPQGDPSLFPKAHGISDGDLRRLPASLVG
jgi:2-oxoglutarate dehydrogenase E1 component